MADDINDQLMTILYERCANTHEDEDGDVKMGEGKTDGGDKAAYQKLKNGNKYVLVMYDQSRNSKTDWYCNQ